MWILVPPTDSLKTESAKAPNAYPYALVRNRRKKKLGNLTVPVSSPSRRSRVVIPGPRQYVLNLGVRQHI